MCHFVHTMDRNLGEQGMHSERGSPSAYFAHGEYIKKANCKFYLNICTGIRFDWVFSR